MEQKWVGTKLSKQTLYFITTVMGSHYGVLSKGMTVSLVGKYLTKVSAMRPLLPSHS